MCIYIYISCLPLFLQSISFQGWGFPCNGSPVGGEDCYWNKGLNHQPLSTSSNNSSKGERRKKKYWFYELSLCDNPECRSLATETAACCNRSMTSGKVEIEVSLHMHWIEKSDSCLRQWNDCPWDLWDIWTASGSNMSMGDGRCYWLLTMMTLETDTD